MCLIDVPNLKEIDHWEDYFYVVQKILQKQCEEEENVKKIGQFLEVYILFTTNPISFKFDMLDHVCMCRA